MTRLFLGANRHTSAINLLHQVVHQVVQEVKLNWANQQRRREDEYLRRLLSVDTFRADANGYLRMCGYTEELFWFRDLLACRYGEDVVGPVVNEDYPYFQFHLTRLLSRRKLPYIYDQAERRWAEVDKACLRRWILPLEVNTLRRDH